ncbi:hypothetical protein MtrunA17_Chr3g0135581 [Medicago truncatula]|nr:hypothetical protein MtrunA17_Chr3g0135581 [Medicago truncatula]
MASVRQILKIPRVSSTNSGMFFTRFLSSSSNRKWTEKAHHCTCCTCLNEIVKTS